MFLTVGAGIGLPEDDSSMPLPIAQCSLKDFAYCTTRQA